MERSSFATSTFGECISDRVEGVSWFKPASLPRALKLDGETIMALTDAEAALGRLSGTGGQLRDPQLLLRPYAVREALASARIEGTQARLTEVFQAEAQTSRQVYGDLRSMRAHLDATRFGIEHIADSDLSLTLLLDLHAILMMGTTRSADAGTFRDELVWLGSPTDRPENAVFVPPVGDAMRVALEDLKNFLATPPRMPALVRCALLHYQFLTIHPFVDGNGRIGRLMILLFLLREKRLTAPLLYLSAYFERNRIQYYDRLQAVRERGEIQEWLQFFFTAINVQANDAVARAEILLSLREEYREALAGNRSRALEVVELLFENPVITTTMVRQRLQMTSQGALNLLRGLQNRGWLTMLRDRQGRGGSTFWIAPMIYQYVGDEPIEELEASGSI